MDTLVLHTHVSEDGHVTFLLPAEFANQAVEVVVRRSPKLATSEWKIGAVESADNAGDGVGQSDGKHDGQDTVE
jgi:hypothetical protein